MSDCRLKAATKKFEWLLPRKSADKTDIDVERKKEKSFFVRWEQWGLMDERKQISAREEGKTHYLRMAPPARVINVNSRVSFRHCSRISDSRRQKLITPGYLNKPDRRSAPDGRVTPFDREKIDPWYQPTLSTLSSDRRFSLRLEEQNRKIEKRRGEKTLFSSIERTEPRNKIKKW